MPHWHRGRGSSGRGVVRGLSRETLGLVVGTIGVVIFGVTLPMTRIAVISFDPWFVTMGRAVLAGGIALLVLAIVKPPLLSRSELIKLVSAAIFVVGGFPAFVSFAMKSVPAAHGGVVLGILPLIVALLGALTAGERPSIAFWVSALLGAALVIGFSLRDGGGSLDWNDFLLIGAVLSAAFGYTILADLTKTRSGWEVISWVVVVSLPVTLPVAYLASPTNFSSIPARHWGAFLYLGLMSQYIGFFFWNAGLAMGGQARVSQTQLLQTFVTLAFAAWINGEAIDLMTWFFAVAVVAVVLVGRKARIEKVASK